MKTVERSTTELRYICDGCGLEYKRKFDAKRCEEIHLRNKCPHTTFTYEASIMWGDVFTRLDCIKKCSGCGLVTEVEEIAIPDLKKIPSDLVEAIFKWNEQEKEKK